jgi:cytochrome c5
MKYILSIGIMALIVSSCATKMVITQADADRGAAKFPGYTLADMQKGKDLFDKHCGACHGLPKPGSRDEAGWNQILPPMVKKTNGKAGSTVIDAQGEESIRRYLITMSAASK